MFLRLHRSLFFVLIGFTVVYACIAFVNHYCFRTYALDLGAYTAALFDYAHFNFHDSTSFKPYAENLLADHFDLYLPLISPFSWVFGSITLLVVQWLALLVGGIGIYKTIFRVHPKSAIPATLFFLFFFGVISAVSFDYHSNVIAACFIPWLFYALANQNKVHFILLVLLIVIARENMSLLLFFLLPACLFIEKNLSPSFKKIIVLTTIGCLIYFVVITVFVMPSLAQSGKLNQFRYAVLGEGYSDALKNMFTSPFKYAKILFTNHSGNINFDGIKTEFWIFLALSGGVLLLFNWPFVFALLPILGQKLFHNQPEMWGINDHYSAEIAPVLTIGVFYTLHKRQFLKNRFKWLQYMVLFISIGLTVRMMDNPSALVRKDNIRLYKAAHYKSVIEHTAFDEVKKLIPANAPLACQGLLHPHFAWRDKIYLFPFVHDADYILLYKHADFWPLPQLEFNNRLTTLSKNPEWVLVFEKQGLLLYKKRE